MSVAKTQARSAIEGVIRKAADRTGVDFGFLLKTAHRESSLNPRAKAGTSSAAGLFQFVEQTWLGQMKRHGAKHGYGAYAAMIEKGADGRLRCNSDEAHRAVMNMRFDASCSSLMAGELASDHAAYLKGRIGRDPTEGELYAAHFMGPKGAAKLIEAQDRSPEASAAGLFPQAASANRSIFYRNGRAASAADVYAYLTRSTPAGEAGSSSVREAAPAARERPTYRVLGDEPSRAAYALETRLQQTRQEQSLVQQVLNGDDARNGGFGAGLFSAEMLSVLAGSNSKDES